MKDQQRQNTLEELKAKVAGVQIDVTSLFAAFKEKYPTLNKRDFAEILGIESGTLSDYTGQKKAIPSLKVAIKAAIIVDADLRDLAMREENTITS